MLPDTLLPINGYAQMHPGWMHGQLINSINLKGYFNAGI
jgi:hypothetical protein